MPTQRGSGINWERAALLYCMMTAKKVDYLRILYKQFEDRITTSDFFFPCLITQLCKHVGIKLTDNDEVLSGAVINLNNYNQILNLDPDERERRQAIKTEPQEEGEGSKKKAPTGSKRRKESDVPSSTLVPKRSRASARVAALSKESKSKRPPQRVVLSSSSDEDEETLTFKRKRPSTLAEQTPLQSESQPPPPPSPSVSRKTRVPPRQRREPRPQSQSASVPPPEVEEPIEEIPLSPARPGGNFVTKPIEEIVRNVASILKRGGELSISNFPQKPHCLFQIINYCKR